MTDEKDDKKVITEADGHEQIPKNRGKRGRKSKQQLAEEAAAQALRTDGTRPETAAQTSAQTAPPGADTTSFMNLMGGGSAQVAPVGAQHLAGVRDPQEHLAYTGQHLFERDEANQLLGRIQLGQGLAKLVTVTTLIDLKKIKESKSYKHLSAKDQDGKTVTVTTFQEFCKLLGYSYEKVNTDLQNLEAFGTEAFESMQRAGLGYRQLRQIRKLPEADRNLIVQEVEADVGDKDAILQLIDELSEKHVTERTALTQQIEVATQRARQAEQETSIRDQQLADAQESLNKMDAEVRRLSRLEEEKPDEARVLWAEEFVRVVHRAGNCYVGLRRALTRAHEIEGDTPEWIQYVMSAGIAGLIAELESLQRGYELNPFAEAPSLVDWVNPENVLPQYREEFEKKQAQQQTQVN